MVQRLRGTQLIRRNEDYALALVDGAFNKALEIQLVRKVRRPACARCSWAAVPRRTRLGQHAILDASV